MHFLDAFCPATTRGSCLLEFKPKILFEIYSLPPESCVIYTINFMKSYEIILWNFVVWISISDAILASSASFNEVESFGIIQPVFKFRCPLD